MATFHDNKLWQEAYVSSLDVAEVFDALPTSELAARVKQTAFDILTTIADGLARGDQRQMEAKLADVGGLVGAIRSLLSVAWAQELISDEQFGKLDGAYENLSKLLK